MQQAASSDCGNLYGMAKTFACTLHVEVHIDPSLDLDVPSTFCVGGQKLRYMEGVKTSRVSCTTLPEDTHTHTPHTHCTSTACCTIHPLHTGYTRTTTYPHTHTHTNSCMQVARAYASACKSLHVYMQACARRKSTQPFAPTHVFARVHFCACIVRNLLHARICTFV